MTVPITVSIITPAHQAFEGLLRIYNEIRCILSSEIIWYIKDSGECERTAEYFKNKEHICLDTRSFLKRVLIVLPFSSDIQQCHGFCPLDVILMLISNLGL